MWDIIGKAKNLPVYKLLSFESEPSNKVKIYASGGVSHAWYDQGEQDLIDEALKYKQLGYNTFKFRNGTSWKYSKLTMAQYIPILERLRAAHIQPAFNRPWYDVDTVDDLRFLQLHLDALSLEDPENAPCPFTRAVLGELTVPE